MSLLGRRTFIPGRLRGCSVLLDSSTLGFSISCLLGSGSTDALSWVGCFGDEELLLSSFGRGLLGSARAPSCERAAVEDRDHGLAGAGFCWGAPTNSAITGFGLCVSSTEFKIALLPWPIRSSVFSSGVGLAGWGASMEGLDKMLEKSNSSRLNGVAGEEMAFSWKVRVNLESFLPIE